MIDRAKRFAQLGVAVIACTGLWLGLGRVTSRHSPKAKAAPPNADISQIQDRLTRTEQELELLKLRGAAVPAAAAQVAASAPAPAEATAAAKPEATNDAASVQAALDDRAATLDATLAVDAPDPIWSRARESELVAMLERTHQPDSRLLSAHCGASFCKLEFENSTPAAALALRELKTEPELLHNQVFGYSSDPNGKSLTLYVGRDRKPLFSD